MKFDGEWKETEIGKIPEDWDIDTLNNVCLKITDGSHTSPKSFLNGCLMASVKDMSDYGFVFEECKRISKEDYELLVKNDCKPLLNDVLIAKDGSFLKHIFVVKKEIDMVILSSIAILRPNLNEVSPEFLKYYLSSNETKQRIKEGYVTGSVLPRIVLKDFKTIKIILPSLSEQKAIARILSSFDDKIELNSRMNKTLEEIGQSLFKHWFIDFEFPGFNGELVDEIPKGWKKYTITELLDTVSVTHKFPKGKAIFLNTSDILDGIFLHENYSDVSELPGQAKKTIRKGDILFSEIRPANKRYAYVDFEADDYVVSTKLMVLRSKGIANSLVLYFYLKRPEVLSNLQLLAESRSGTFPQITYSELSKIEMNIPDEKTLSQYNEVIHSIFSKIRINQNENSSLIRIRDTLLPKLMSGEISVKDIC